MDYFLLKSDGKYYLLTDRKEKTDSSFEYWRNHYRKEIDPYDECVEECYDISFHVVYDVGISGVDDDWRLLGDCNLAENIVYLNDGNNHDGWEYVDRGWSRKKIDLRDVKDQYVLKEICIKNGSSYSCVERTCEPDTFSCDGTKIQQCINNDLVDVADCADSNLICKGGVCVKS